MSERDFEAEAGEGDELAALKKSLLRVYAASMARGRVDEARKTLQVLARYLPEAAGPTAQHPAEIELEAVASHLAHLAPIGTPPTELARLAAARILDLDYGQANQKVTLPQLSKGNPMSATPLLPPTLRFLEDVIFKGRPALKEQATAANEELAQVAQQVAGHNANCSATAKIDVESDAFATGVAMNFGLDSQVQVLQAVLRFRRDTWGPFSEAIMAALLEERDLSFKKHEAAKTKIRKVLVREGWQDADPGVRDPSRIQPIFIMSHPSVRSALEHYQSIMSRSNNSSFAWENQQGVRACLGALDRIRRTRIASRDSTGPA